MDHVGILRWHSAKTLADMKKWEKMLNRGGSFKITMSTKVCSNHFTAGYCSDICPIPTLYLKGYEISKPPRKSPRKRVSIEELDTPAKIKKTRHVYHDSGEDIIDYSVLLTPLPCDHDYEIIERQHSSKSMRYILCRNCNKVRKNAAALIEKNY